LSIGIHTLHIVTGTPHHHFQAGPAFSMRADACLAASGPTKVGLPIRCSTNVARAWQIPNGLVFEESRVASGLRPFSVNVNVLRNVFQGAQPRYVVQLRVSSPLLRRVATATRFRQSKRLKTRAPRKFSCPGEVGGSRISCARLTLST